MVRTHQPANGLETYTARAGPVSLFPLAPWPLPQTAPSEKRGPLSHMQRAGLGACSAKARGRQSDRDTATSGSQGTRRGTACLVRSGHASSPGQARALSLAQRVARQWFDEWCTGVELCSVCAGDHALCVLSFQFSI